jgi:TolA-binding protein
MNTGKRRTGGRAAWVLAAGLGAVAAFGASVPARAQDATEQQRQAPAGAARLANLPSSEPGVAATTPLTDLLTRMDSLEAQVARLTAQNEEMANRQRQLEARLVASPATAAATTTVPTPATPAAAPAPLAGKSATASNLSAMAGAAADRAADRVGEARAATPAHPSAQRIAAVKAVIKPQTANGAFDDYTYGFRLYTAKFYPEAAQQLKLYIDKYPRDAHISHARNLLGRAYLDDGKPRDAAPWFLMNYKTDPQGPRAADSLLNLAAAMRQLGDNSRACIALNEFAANYAPEAKGRLRADYARTRGGLTCN